MARLLVWTLASLLAAPALATGVLVTDSGVVQGTSCVVRVKAATQVARTIVIQTFENRTAAPLRGSYVFPVPTLATLVGLVDVSGGQRCVVPLSIKDKGPAAGAAPPPAGPAAAGAPAVLGRCEIPVNPIAPGGSLTLEFTYEEILPYSDGQVRYSFPLVSPVAGQVPLRGFHLMAKILDQRGVTVVQCPTHQVGASYNSQGFWDITHRSDPLPAGAEFIIDYTLPSDAISAAFLGGQDADLENAKTGDRYILALLSPREQGRVASGTVRPPVAPLPATPAVRAAAPAPSPSPRPAARTVGPDRLAAKEVVFLMDTSGSMEGRKLSEAKASFKTCIEKLNPQDRFNVIAFDSELNGLWNERRAASGSNVKAALRWVERLEADGKTDLFAALKRALSDLDRSDGARYVYLLTDGNPTEGECNPDRIVDGYARLNVRHARLFAFGIGDDVSRSLLDRLALGSRGDAVSVTPDAQIQKQVTQKFQKMARPLLLDPKVAFEGLPVTDVYPETLADLAQGSQVVVVARIAGPVQPGAAMVLTGRVDTQAYTYRYPIPEDFMHQVSRAVPRLWARGKIDHLWRRMRVEGESAELRRQILDLGSRYHLQTPFTQYASVTNAPPSPAPIVPFTLARPASGLVRPTQAIGPSGSTVTVSNTPVDRVRPYRWQFYGGLPRLLQLPLMNFAAARERANTRACFANQQTLAGAVEMFNLDKNTRCTVIDPTFLEALKQGGYLQSLPQDPGLGQGSSTNYRWVSTGNGVECTVHGQIQSDGSGLPAQVEVMNADGSRTLHPVREVVPPWHRTADAFSLLVDLVLALGELVVGYWMLRGLVRCDPVKVKAVPA